MNAIKLLFSRKPYQYKIKLFAFSQRTKTDAYALVERLKQCLILFYAYAPKSLLGGQLLIDSIHDNKRN